MTGWHQVGKKPGDQLEYTRPLRHFSQPRSCLAKPTVTQLRPQCLTAPRGHRRGQNRAEGYELAPGSPSATYNMSRDRRGCRYQSTTRRLRNLLRTERPNSEEAPSGGRPTRFRLSRWSTFVTVDIAVNGGGGVAALLRLLNIVSWYGCSDETSFHSTTKITSK